MSNLNTSHEQLLAYWEHRARTAATDCECVDWSRRAQRMRFEVFILNHDLRGKSVLDVGCGVADFRDHLQARGIACDYVGVDISTEMVRRSRLRFPELRFEIVNILEWEPRRSFDYSVAFGVQNIRVDGGREMLERVTRRQFEFTRVAAYICLLTNRYLGFAAHIQSWPAEEVLKLALETTPYVVLRHDYLPNDFSVAMYREPLIDTARGLFLE
jgi:SAM-dependent methyltransferase